MPLKGIRDRVDRTLGAARNKRTEGRLRLAARYTQRMWRSKRAYAFNDENARPRRPRPFPSDEVCACVNAGQGHEARPRNFARADGEVEHASAGAPFVVEEGERIVQVGATEQYEIKFTSRWAVAARRVQAPFLFGADLCPLRW